MKIKKRNLILLILALVVFIGTGYWVFSMYKVNKTIDQLKSDDWRVKEQATKDLTKLGKLAVGPLIAALKDKDPEIRWRAARALGKTKDNRAIEPLGLSVKDEDKRVRYRAVQALDVIGGDQVIKPLIFALKDDDIDIIEKAVRALIKIGKPAVKSLISILDNKDNNYIRIKAAEILGEIGDERAAKPLIVALKDEDNQVRMEAAKAIIEIGEPAVEPLIMGFKNEDEFGKWRTAVILKNITGEYFGRSPEKWQKWWEQNKDRYSTQNENK